MHKVTDDLNKGIHFPIQQPIYTPTPKRNLLQKFVNFITYRRKFKIRADYILWVPSLNRFIFIPEYFVYDGASVPKILNGIFNPTGMLLLGACPHDFGYRYQGLFFVNPSTREIQFSTFSKPQLDEIFKDLCIHESKMKAASTVATFTLSLFGFLGWRENRKANNVLRKDFPELFVPYEDDEDYYP